MAPSALPLGVERWARDEYGIWLGVAPSLPPTVDAIYRPGPGDPPRASVALRAGLSESRVRAVVQQIAAAVAGAGHGVA